MSGCCATVNVHQRESLVESDYNDNDNDNGERRPQLLKNEGTGQQIETIYSAIFRKRLHVSEKDEEEGGEGESWNVCSNDRGSRIAATVQAAVLVESD
ncbi:hypothetical protein H072_2257 [Dactylellina haptotyla CBS 200.50]|uniref:Uncharacterized protein n=1 Tax=Dactylellina haptotyla (strain CBS 200.50) TaxID=1284197 RepID=S8ALE1_DACHA|nr:hypothetical protein H072_2257 [Dactylellina haptotyla CBS 200.50]